MDPELGESFAEASLEEVEVPVTIINLGSPGATIPGLDASRVARAMPHATYQLIADATPFSAFAECTPEAVALLQEEGEDGAICDDGGNRSRAEIHAQLVEEIASCLKRELLGAPRRAAP